MCVLKIKRGQIPIVNPFVSKAQIYGEFDRILVGMHFDFVMIVAVEDGSDQSLASERSAHFQNINLDSILIATVYSYLNIFRINLNASKHQAIEP